MSVRERPQAAGWSFWFAAVTSVVAILAIALFAIEPQWIERFVGSSPDDGSGESEWWIMAIAAFVAAVSLAVTRLKWRASARLAQTADG